MLTTRFRDQAANVPARTFLIEPFDIGLHSTESGVAVLQSRFATWLRSLRGPARFLCWLIPTTLNDKIDTLSQRSRELGPHAGIRGDLLMEYRRYYEALQSTARYHRAMCGTAIWTEENARALLNGMVSAFQTPVIESRWPALFEGKYQVLTTPFGHLAPTGRPGGRMLWSILNSYEFLPAEWNFFKPVKDLLSVNFPLVIAIDIPYTYERIEGIEAIEGNIAAYNVHLASLHGAEDSRAVQRIVDCRRTLQEINNGDALHKVQVTLAVAAPDLKALKERVALISTVTRPWFLSRQETGELLRRSVGYFAAQPTRQINIPDTTWRVTSRELALMLAPLGYPKLASTDGVLRGETVEGHYPVFQNSWKDRRATHEIWVGMSGQGKTYLNNCYLLREYAENGIPFDLLEPMGHGKHIAQAIGIAPFNLSARSTTLNPQDIMYSTLIEQKSHTTRLYETVLGRSLSGGQKQNLERGLLGEALDMVYRGFSNLDDVTPEQVPTCTDVCDVLVGLGDTTRKKRLAHELADEISGLCCGTGPWAAFLDGETNVDLSRGGRQWIGPRVFSFHEMSDDPILLALAYTQVLSAIRRDSLIDEQFRIIAVDEVYRLMRYPSLLDFLIEAAKTFRTRRKKLICIDQNMMYFLQDKARYVFENSPIRVIFSQKQGMNVFREDAAFQHFNQQHLDTIAQLKNYEYVLDIQGEGIWYLHSITSEDEQRRFDMT